MSNDLPTLAARALAQLVGTPLQRSSTASLLQALAELTAGLAPGHLEASVTLLEHGDTTTAASSAPLAAELDQVQYSAGQGPCLQAAATDEPVEVTDTRSDTRWAGFGPQAAARGVLGTLSLPLVGGQVTGSLNVYARQTAVLTPGTRSAAGRLASCATTAVGNLRDYEAVRDRVDRLEDALRTGVVVDQAAGMLVEREGRTPADALRVLADVAARAGVPVEGVAVRLVRTGELPGHDRR